MLTNLVNSGWFWVFFIPGSLFSLGWLIDDERRQTKRDRKEQREDHH